MTDDLSPFFSWVNHYFEVQGLPHPLLTAIDGDAGFRRYFCLSIQGKSLPYLAVYAPPAHEDNHAFVQVCKILCVGQVAAPYIYAQDLEQGFLLVEKLGDQVLLEQLNSDTVEELYHKAMTTLLKLQQCRYKIENLPRYDRQALLQEMTLFTQWFVPKLLGHQLSDDENTLIVHFFDSLMTTALEQTMCLVHRDYHSRNLVVRDEQACFGVIDFQDAVVGPVTYDLVSLLRDCYILWPADQVEGWALDYKARLVSQGLLPERLSDEQFIRHFDWMGLQRHIKVLGIFARLSLRDGKHRYLDDLPLVIHYVRTVAAKYESLIEFCQWFESVIMPLVRERSWFREISPLGDGA